MEGIRLLADIGLIVVLLALSAFFSGSETALFSLDRLQLRKMDDQNPASRRVKRLLERPSRLLITILIGNMLVNTAASSILASIVVASLGERGIPIVIALMSVLLLVFGEITPKTIAINYAETVAPMVSRPLSWFARIVFPVRIALRKISDLHIALFGGLASSVPALTQDELRTVVDVGHKEGSLGTTEREMLHSVLTFGDTTVGDVMTPRVDIKAAPLDMNQDDLLDFAKGARHSRLPIYQNTMDHVVGILDCRDLFLDPQTPFKDKMRLPLFVPATKKLDDLLQELEGRELDIAIALDEYGGTDGLVTKEDILEEIFGEIHDEFETLVTPIQPLPSGRYRVYGGVTLQELNRRLQLQLPENESAQTLGGFLMGILGSIPSERQSIEYEHVLFFVESMRRHRILYVIVEKQ